MDKLDRQNTIKIKLNNKGKQYKEEEIENKKVVHSQQPEESQEDIDQTAATSTSNEENNKEDESFEWVLPSEEYKEQPTVESSIFTYTSKEKTVNKNRGFQKLVLSVVVAIFVGFGLMYVVLKTITAKEDLPVTKIEETKPVNSQKPSESISLFPMVINVVQGGVFSSKVAAEDQQLQFINQGIPAEVITQKDKYYIVLFASDSLEHAKEISTKYKNQISDAYWKEFTLEGGTSKLSKQDIQKIVATNALFKQLTKVSTNVMLSTGQVDTSKLQSTLQDVQKMKADNVKIDELVSILSSAISEIKENANSFEDSINIQSQLLQYITLYTELIKS
ncbi:MULTISPECIES: hypothetical protein [Bacillus]|uniref:hypothetical protein n=1 Tax=Bacillus TaxID=1386 RepID=UPI0002ED7F40|nr:MULTISPECIES: hypothetical protein [Bacillus]